MFNPNAERGRSSEMGDRMGVSGAVRPALRLLQTHPSDPVDAVAPVIAPDTLTDAITDTDLTPPKGVFYLRTEQAVLLAVTLPKMAASQRRGAVQFAVEDRIAQPLDLVHVVLGPKLRDNGAAADWLVAVVGADVMESQLASAPPGAQAWVLDVLALQPPQAGQWSVLALQDRILVRLADGSGFATTPALLPMLWAADGQPDIVLLGGALPAGVPVAQRMPLAAPDPLIAGFDLRTGRFARRGAGWPKGARALAVVAALAVVGHLVLLGLDILGLSRTADAREAALRAALTEAGQAADGDVEAALTAALARQGPAATGAFLPLLAQAFGAMAAQSGQVQIKDLRFASDQNALTLTIEAPDLAALQTAETAFAGAGLLVSAGAATTGDGAAQSQMTLRRATP